MLPDDPRHGTEAGNEQHLRDNETVCASCADAKIRACRRRRKQRTMGREFTVPVDDSLQVLEAWRAGGASLDDMALHVGIVGSQIHRILDGTRSATIYARTAHAIAAAARRGSPLTTDGVIRRVRALTWLGYSIRAIAEAAGVTEDTVQDARSARTQYTTRSTRIAIADAYTRLHMTIPTGATQQLRSGITRSRRVAAANGWLPPLAWADVDLGVLAEDRPARSGTDAVVVLRILSGDWRLPATPNERAEVLTQWRAAGRSDNELERVTGWNLTRVRQTLTEREETAA